MVIVAVSLCSSTRRSWLKETVQHPTTKGSSRRDPIREIILLLSETKVGSPHFKLPVALRNVLHVPSLIPFIPSE